MKNLILRLQGEPGVRFFYPPVNLIPLIPRSTEVVSPLIKGGENNYKYFVNQAGMVWPAANTCSV
jgi:hypothetical protein